MNRLSVLGYASGSPLSHIVMRRIAAEHDLLAVVTPAGGWRARIKRFLRMRVWRDVAAVGVSERDAARFAPDLILVASYPKILPVAAIGRARIGALNVHMSLLPRHRGVDPVFATYWHDDAQAGVTLHWMDAGMDSGDVAAQQAVPLARGRASRDLYFELAEHAAEMASTLLRRIAGGDLPRTAQAATDARAMNAADIAAARIPFGAWPAERVWHVLSGLGDQRRGLVAGAEGSATGWRATDDVTPGRIEALPDGHALHCRDGIVTLSGGET